MLSLAAGSLGAKGSLKNCANHNEYFLGVIAVVKVEYYSHSCVSRATSWNKPEKKVIFEYQRDVPATAISEAATEYLDKNLNPGEDSNKLKQFNAFNASYRDVGAGDRYILWHSQQQGLELYLNDEFLARLAEPLASQYFEIWFGEYPFSFAMKENLLGLSAEPKPQPRDRD